MKILLVAAEAAGGVRLLGVKSLAMTERGTQMLPDRNVPVDVNWIVAYPYRSRGEVMYGGQRVLQTCDGSSAWIVTGGQARDARPTIEEFKRGTALFGGGWGLYREVLAGIAAGEAAGETEIGGEKALGVMVHGSFGSVKLFFDPATHLLKAARYSSTTAQGTVEAEQRWSDYRKVEGRQFAFSTVTYRSGRKFFESTVTQVKINPPVRNAMFAKPAAAPKGSPVSGQKVDRYLTRRMTLPTFLRS
jgi:hypothetical protein